MYNIEFFCLLYDLYQIGTKTDKTYHSSLLRIVQRISNKQNHSSSKLIPTNRKHQKSLKISVTRNFCTVFLLNSYHHRKMFARFMIIDGREQRELY